jgi:putative DeoR family transcriptional regulator (stage III sporulation protein D)
LKDYIQKRVMDLSCFITERKATVRQAAKHFGVSKSTVHKDVTERLPDLNRDMASEVKHILEVNKAERHIRGGEATKQKYRMHC